CKYNLWMLIVDSHSYFPSKKSTSRAKTFIPDHIASFRIQHHVDPLGRLHYLFLPGHCKNFATVYDQVATNLRGIIPVGRVDATSYRDLTNKFEVKGIHPQLYTLFLVK